MNFKERQSKLQEMENELLGKTEDLLHEILGKMTIGERNALTGFFIDDWRRIHRITKFEDMRLDDTEFDIEVIDDLGQTGSPTLSIDEMNLIITFIFDNNLIKDV